MSGKSCSTCKWYQQEHDDVMCTEPAFLASGIERSCNQFNKWQPRLSGKSAELRTGTAMVADNGTLRTFPSGATRDTSANKPDYARYESAAVVREFGKYMLKHQTQSDGQWRPGDNWKKGFGMDVLISSGDRHWQDIKGVVTEPALWQGVDLIESLCAMRFNINAMLLEAVRARNGVESVHHSPTSVDKARKESALDGQNIGVMRDEAEAKANEEG